MYCTRLVQVKILFFVLISIFNTSISLAQNVWVTEYYDFESKILKCEYQIDKTKPSKLNGIYISYYHDGMIHSKGKYTNSLQNGNWIYYYQNGNKKSSGAYILGEKSGNWEYFYENGTVSQTGKLISNKRHGYWKYFFESGGLKTEGEYLLDKNNGLWLYYNEDGTNKATCNFRNGEGIYTEKYSNGGIKMTGLITNGASDSLWTYYYESGTKKAEGFEKNGIKVGKWRFYNSDKSLSSEGDFVANLENGPWIYYYPNGQVSSKGIMESGKKQGVWNLFYENGKFMGEAHFENGYGKYVEYFNNGKIKMSGFISGNAYTGSWMYYYEDGSLEGECYYVNGEGDYLGYYQDGSKKMFGRLKNGKKIRVWKLYDNDGNLTGLYKSYFDTDEIKSPSDSNKLKINELATVSHKAKTGTKFRFRYNQLFRPRINENQSVLINANPIAPIFNSLPVSIEYYFDRRVGYELGLIFIRKPFFDNHSLYLAQLYNSSVQQGGEVFLRQKIYFGRKKPDTYYIGQELRYSLVEYQATNKGFSLDSSNNGKILAATEHKIEFSLLIGKRLFFNIEDSKFSIDVYSGIGIGYRYLPPNPYKNLIYDLPKNQLSLPWRLGIMFGYQI